MFHALRVRDFRLLWSGDLISSLGSWMLILAIPAHVLLVTGSLRASGLTLAAQYAPMLVLGPVAGICADRWDRRRLQIAADLVRAGAVAAMLAGLSPGRLWIVFVALVTESSAGVLYAPASQARTPDIVGTGPLLASANSLYAATDGVVRLIGGPLGAVLLVSIGIRWLIVADVVSYLVSAGAIALTSRADAASGHAREQATIAALVHDLTDGLRALRDDRLASALLPVTVIFLAANASLSAVLIPFGVRRLGGAPHTGLLLSCLGAGFLAGAPILRALVDRVRPRILLPVTLTGTAAGYFALFTAGGLTVALPAAVLIGMFGSMSEIIPLTAVQRAVAGAVLGRVCAVFMTCEAAATLIGSAAGPFLAQAAQFSGLAAVASAATVCAAALALFGLPSAGRGGVRRRLHAE
jgi:MFS family permease